MKMNMSPRGGRLSHHYCNQVGVLQLDVCKLGRRSNHGGQNNFDSKFFTKLIHKNKFKLSYAKMLTKNYLRKTTVVYGVVETSIFYHIYI